MTLAAIILLLIIGIGVGLMIFGIQSIFHYFQIRSSGVDVGEDLYQLDNLLKVYTGEKAQIRARGYLVVGTFCTILGSLPIVLLIGYLLVSGLR